MHVHNWSPGDRVNEYRLERPLGRGAAGLIFEAVHTELGLRAVIKLLRPDRASMHNLARLQREGQALARLEHDGIVKLRHDGRLDDGTYYLVLEHFAGVSLRQFLIDRARPLRIDEVVAVLAQLSAALAYAHEQGIAHRDVKPENLLIRADPRAPGGLRVLLIDFGIAHVSETVLPSLPPRPAEETQLDTHEYAILGTPPYCAPEQCPLARDAYAVGVLGWELLAGSPPLPDALTERQAMLAQRRDVPSELVTLIWCLLAKEAMARPPLREMAQCTAALARRYQAGRPSEHVIGSRALTKKFAQGLARLHLVLRMVPVFLGVALALIFVRDSLPPQSLSSATAPQMPVVVLAHPVLGTISEAEIRSALPAAQEIKRRVDIAPLRQLGAQVAALDWTRLAEEQTRLVETELSPLLHTAPTPRVAYFGLAPVPLAIQLGTRLSALTSVSIYLRNHTRAVWRWPQKGPTQEVLTSGLPCPTRADAVEVMLRVATSYPIEPQLTQPLVPAADCEIDVRLRAPDPDALRSEEDVEAVGAAFQQALTVLPGNTRVVHLFAAVPVGMAMELGRMISPTVHPPIQTYQYERNQTPRYRKALLLNLPPSPPADKEESMATKSPAVIEQRIELFVDWLKPDADTESAMRRQADEIRRLIREQADADGLTVRSTPGAGSFVKNTGLRRHHTGGSSVDGQDVDIPFVLGPLSQEERRLSRLLNRFQSYVDRAYPQNPPEKSRTNSSIKIKFTGKKLSYDLVPMIIAEQFGENYQLLLRGDGKERLTSVKRHNDFIRTRTDDSNKLPGRVKFNECVRLLKWWREFRMDRDKRSIPNVPSIVIDMLAAYAYDNKRVQPTYAETLRTWFDFLYTVVKKRQTIRFSDFPPPRGRRHAPPSAWSIIDPVDPENNLTHDWIDQHIDELADWLLRARDDMQHAIDLDRRDNHQESLHYLVRLFGPPFKQHSELPGTGGQP